MQIKNEVRQTLRILASKCGYDEFVILGGKKWSVGMMSYNEFFLEPFRKGKKETDKFSENTLWEKSDLGEILQLLVDAHYYTITKI